MSMKHDAGAANGGMGEVRLIFLGTGAGRPSRTRNVSAVAMTLPEPAGGAFWLFDAGEATQHKLLETGLKLNKLEKIFITHLHGDHLYGLPGLLGSRSFMEGAGKLQLFGPPGLQPYLEHTFAVSGTRLTYELEIVEIVAGQRLEDERFLVETAALDHRIDCFGYRVIERPKPGPLDAAKLIRLGVPPGPLFGRIKQGEDIALPDGRLVRAAEAVGPATPGRIVAILGDTRPCDNAITLARGADVLVHEATFAPGMEAKAAAYGHSTLLQAARIAREAKAGRLVVTHFSPRLDDGLLEWLVNDVRAIFPRVDAAWDGFGLDVPPRAPDREPD